MNICRLNSRHIISSHNMAKLYVDGYVNVDIIEIG